MRLIFIDETSDRKFKNFLGFSICTVDSRFYSRIKKNAHEILRAVEWSPSIEFKGSHLFSASKGCTAVEVQRRVEAAHRLLDLNISLKNCRMRFSFGKLSSVDHAGDYLRLLPGLLHKALPTALKGAGKDLAAVVVDERSDVKAQEVHEALKPAVAKRGYVLFEQVIVARSSFDTVGLMFADLVGYLQGRIETISNDVEFLDGIPEQHFEMNGSLMKLRSSKELIAKLKSLDVYVPKPT